MFDARGINNLSPFRLPETRAGNPSDKDLQRAEGSCRILLSGSGSGTRVMDVFQRSLVRVMFPRAGGGAVNESVLINTAGGIAGGDRLEYSVTALAGASMVVTSQAAEKVYRALNVPAQISTKLKAHEGAKLAWLPQETIIFNWARLSRNTEINLASGAELLALEWLVLGRAAHGENIVGGHITDSWRVKKDGRLVWADTFRATDEAFPQVQEGSAFEFQSHCHADLFRTRSRHTAEVLARPCFFSGMRLRCDVGRRTHHRSFCGQCVVQSAARLTQFSSAIRPSIWPRPFPRAEDVVVLMRANERRSS